MTSLRNHTKSAHKIAIKEYKEKYGNPKEHIVEEIFHECGLCHEVWMGNLKIFHNINMFINSGRAT